MTKSLKGLQKEIVQCQRCPRLVKYREEVAARKRRAYQDWEYWGRPVPSLGPADAKLLIVGLAPGAHGANRTGRMFTGDGSGSLLFETLYQNGFCDQPESVHREDGLQLLDTFITAALHCVPPRNRPSSREANRCRTYLVQELELLENIHVVVALGAIAWQAYLRARTELGRSVPRPRPKFGHHVRVDLKDVFLLGCYHPSRQNTQTGVLTKRMFDSVFREARKLCEAA